MQDNGEIIMMLSVTQSLPRLISGSDTKACSPYDQQSLSALLRLVSDCFSVDAEANAHDLGRPFVAQAVLLAGDRAKARHHAPFCGKCVEVLHNRG